MSPSKTPGGRHAIRAGRAAYLKEREAHRAKLRRRRELVAQEAEKDERDNSKADTQNQQTEEVDNA